MDDSEKISGKKIFDILEQLKKNHTILNIHVMDTDFDGISIILGVSDGEKPRFFIDYPGRADSFAPLSAGKKCYFEFSDESKIKYSFKATIYSIFGKRIKFDFPEFIERSQRRKAFRVTAPIGTRVSFTANDKKYQFNVTNISEGGLLICIKSASVGKGVIFEGNKLKKILFSAKMENSSVNLNIASAEIVRMEKNDENCMITCGLKFIDIDKKDQDELRRYIYFCQRKELKKRGELDI